MENKYIQINKRIKSLITYPALLVKYWWGLRPSDIHDFCHRHKLALDIRYRPDLEKSVCFSCYFTYTHVIEETSSGEVMMWIGGHGASVDEAVNDFCNSMYKRTISITVDGVIRSRIKIPKLTVKEKGSFEFIDFTEDKKSSTIHIL